MLPFQVDISTFPTVLADALNISVFAGQLLASMILLCFFLFPTMLLTHKKTDQTIPIVFVGFGVMGICIALGWLPYYLLLIVALIVALMFSSKMRDWISGR